jgi:hypothetical protein
METVNGPLLLGRQQKFGRRVAMHPRRFFSQPAIRLLVVRSHTGPTTAESLGFYHWFAWAKIETLYETIEQKMILTKPFEDRTIKYKALIRSMITRRL